MKEQPIKGWVKEKPDFKEDCLLIVASEIRNQWEHTLFEIKKTDCDEGWYWGAFQDGDEWGDISDIEGHLYMVIPTVNSTPIAEGEERLFTLKEAFDIWDSGSQFGLDPFDTATKQQYFSEKFGILLSSEQNVHQSTIKRNP